MKHNNFYFTIFSFILLSSLAAGCGEASEDQNNTTPSIDIDTEPYEYPDPQVDTPFVTNGQVASPAATQCGNHKCKTNLAKAQKLLVAGKFAEAFEEYKCGDTVEAAFGAALTKTATLVETQTITDILAQFGFGPFPVADLIGPDGVVSRLGKHSKGSGGFTLQMEKQTIKADFDNVRANTEEGLDLRAESFPPHGDAILWLDYWGSAPLFPGVIHHYQYDCEEGSFVTHSADLDIYFGLDVATSDGQKFDCSIGIKPSDNRCFEGEGRIEITKLSTVGKPLELVFDNVPAVCALRSGVGDSVTIGSPRPDSGAPGEIGTISGTVQADHLSDDNYTKGLHPLLQDPEPLLENMPKGMTVSSLVADLIPLQEDIALAACYANSADNRNNGPVFSLPAELTGNRQVPVMTREAKILAAFLRAAEAALSIAQSYEVPLRLGMLEDMSDEELVQELNANLGKRKSNHLFDEAQKSLNACLLNLQEAASSEENMGIFPFNNNTQKGYGIFQKWTTAAIDSLKSGSTALPYSEPNIQFDLSSLFTNPPDPEKIDVDPFVLEAYDEIYESGETEYYIVGVEQFQKELLSGVLPQFDYDMEYNLIGENVEDDMVDFGDTLYNRFCLYFGC